MSEILFIRHGPTEWNQDGKIQGRTDIPLSDDGKREVRSWQLADRFHSWSCFCSPLKRARQTASLLGLPDPTLIDALLEMEWGEWEGHTLESLRAIDPMAFRRNEDRGLDFRPPGGESPRDVRDRLSIWLSHLQADSLPAVVVCHKGVIRAAHSLATDWDMTDDPPQKLRDSCAHLYELKSGALRARELNIPLRMS